MERKITRDAFLQTSLRLFVERGFKATTMRAIADQLQIEAPTLYNYVKSKDELLEDQVFFIADQFLTGMQHIADSSYSPAEKIKEVIKLNVRLTSEYPYQVGLLVNEWKHLKEEKLSAFIDSRATYERLFREIVRAGIEQGELRSMDEEVATYSILSSVRWLFSWYTSEQKPINPIELERQLVAFVLGGVQSH